MTDVVEAADVTVAESVDSLETTDAEPNVIPVQGLELPVVDPVMDNTAQAPEPAPADDLADVIEEALEALHNTQNGNAQ